MLPLQATLHEGGEGWALEARRKDAGEKQWASRNHMHSKAIARSMLLFSRRSSEALEKEEILRKRAQGRGNKSVRRAMANSFIPQCDRVLGRKRDARAAAGKMMWRDIHPLEPKWIASVRSPPAVGSPLFTVVKLDASHLKESDRITDGRSHLQSPAVSFFWRSSSSDLRSLARC